MSEVTPGEIDAARRWAESVQSVSPYARIVSLCNALDARDVRIAELTETLRCILTNPNGGECMFCDSDLRLAQAALAANPAPTPAREAETFQHAVGEWADKTFPQSTADSIRAHLSDEVAELADGVDVDAFEAADCLLLLLHLAHKEGFSLIGTAREKHAINQRRQWGVPDDRGVVRHVARTTAPATEEEGTER